MIRTNRPFHGAGGMAGGGRGAPSCNFFTPADGEQIELSGKTHMHLDVKPGDRLYHLVGGAAGHGAPYQRDPKQVLEDVVDEHLRRITRGCSTGRDRPCQHDGGSATNHCLAERSGRHPRANFQRGERGKSNKMRVAFDIGGTFTDVIILANDRRIHTAKVLSLLERIGENIVDCIRSDKSGEPVQNFVHATTIASNAVIERKTARTGLITTQGFRDVLEMMNQKGPTVGDINWQRLPSLIPRRLRFEVAERILTDGRVEHPLHRQGAQDAILKLLAAEVEVIAVCLINSYVNPVHEREIGQLVREASPATVVCLSSDVHPEIREYERTSTTVINASLIPVVGRYMDHLEKHLSQYSKQLLIMQSNGGTITSAMARLRPMYMIESGPAAGVLGAARLASELKLKNVLSFDMGGTTAKVSLIRDGDPMEKAGGEIGSGVSAVHLRGTGHALRVPSIDIVEVGAGGGSMAWIDDAGALRAGPISASADPGPVCYGRGGMEPTVTDANVVLGYMNPESIADNTLRIDRQAAWDSIDKRIAQRLHLDVMTAAYGIIEVANATMMRALRAVSTERGYDIRELTLVAFGGPARFTPPRYAKVWGLPG